MLASYFIALSNHRKVIILSSQARLVMLSAGEINVKSCEEGITGRRRPRC